MTPKKPPKPNLAEHEEEKRPLDDVLKDLLAAKPAPKKSEPGKKAED